MRLDRYRLLPLFFICLLFFLSFPILFPSLRLFYFTPLFVIACYKLNFFQCIALSISIGFLYDLFSPETYFGGTSFVYSLAIILVHRQRKRFFKDNLSTLPLMSFYFSMSSSFFLMIFREKELWQQLTKEGIMTEFVLMPLADAIYAFGFILPLLLFYGKARKGSDYFLSKRA